MHPSIAVSLLALSSLLLSACSRQEPRAAGAVPAVSPASAIRPDPWLGTWQGPEGTFLEIAGGKDKKAYRLTIANLDGPRSFAGRLDGQVLRFERDGVGESVQPGSGAQTGMKWLAEKSDCLVVKQGEGYCRD